MPEKEADAIREIFAVDISEENVENLLQINPEIVVKFHSILKDLFISEYYNKERPELPRIRNELSLRLTNDNPIYFKPRRLSYDEKEKLQKILDSLFTRGIIRESDSPHASPIVLVRKKNSELRLCVDYRFLNKITLRDNYPLPFIEDHLDRLHDKCYYTLLDLTDGFHHINVATDSIKDTAFITPLSQYEYLKMPFGLKTAPAKFQRFVNMVFSD